MQMTTSSFFFLYWQTLQWSIAVLMTCLSLSSVDPEVQRLKVIINCPQPGSPWAFNGPPPVSRWSG